MTTDPTRSPFLPRFFSWCSKNTPLLWVGLCVGIFLLVQGGQGTYLGGSIWVSEPLYRPITLGYSVLPGGIAQIPGYVYSVVERAFPTPPAMADWPSLLFGIGLIGCLSGLFASISFLPTTGTVAQVRFWVLMGGIALASSFLATDALSVNLPYGQAWRAYVVLANVGGVYAFQAFFIRKRWAIRLLVLFLINASWLLTLPLWAGEGCYVLWAGYAAGVPMVLACLFAFQVAYVFPYAALLLAVRQNVNGVFAFALILAFGAGNILLSYLAEQGLFEGALFQLNGLWVLAILALAGLAAYKRMVAEDANWFTLPALAPQVYASWAGLTFLYLGWAGFTQNGPVLEVVEDAANLSVVCVSAGFLVYVLVNFGVPLSRRQRVDRVLFSPYQLPFSSVMAIAATGLFIFSVNNNNFQYYQAKAGIYNALGDGYYHRKEYQSADLFYQESTHNYLYNFHANYMLGRLCNAKGKPKEAQAYWQQAVLVKPEPAGYLALAESYRQEGVFVEQALALSEGQHKFLADEGLASNLLITYLGTNLVDSVSRLAIPLSKSGGYAAQTNVRAAVAQGKWLQPLPLAAAGAVANWYLGTTPKQEYGSLLKRVSDTSTAESLPGYMALFNGLVLAERPDISLKKIDTLLESLQGGFREDMLYARAWALWRQGNRLQALEDMLALASPNSLSASTYYTTAALWAHDLGNLPFAKKIATGGEGKVHESLLALLTPDSAVLDGPPASLTEEQRVKWAWAKGATLSSEGVANLAGDFKNLALARAFVWAAAKENKQQAQVWERALKVLQPGKDSASKGLDMCLAWAAAESFLGEGIALAKGLPPNYATLLGNLGKQVSQYHAQPTAAALTALVQAYPFSATLWKKSIEKADGKRDLQQPLFEVAARAYALDKENAFLKETYISLAKSLNLDFFAEEALKD